MDEKNHHLHKPVFIGEIKADGQFNVVWKTQGPVVAEPWSPFIPENKGKKNEPEEVSKRRAPRSDGGTPRAAAAPVALLPRWLRAA